MGGVAPALAMVQGDSACEMSCCELTQSKSSDHSGPVPERLHGWDDCQIQPCVPQDLPARLEFQCNCRSTTKVQYQPVFIHLADPIEDISGPSGIQTHVADGRMCNSGRDILTSHSILII